MQDVVFAIGQAKTKGRAVNQKQKRRLGSSLCILSVLGCMAAVPFNARTLAFEVVSSTTSPSLAVGSFNTYENTTGEGSSSYRQIYDTANIAVSASAGFGFVVDAVLDVLGVSIPFVNQNSSTSTIQFDTTLRLVGDPGAFASVTAGMSLDGYYLHSIEAVPRSDALSKVTGVVSVITAGEEVWTKQLNHEKNHNDYLFYNDYSLKEFATEKSDSSPFIMRVGDEVSISATLTVFSKANLQETCTTFPLELCVSGSGGVVSTTGGGFNYRLSASEYIPEEPPAVPLPASFGFLLAGVTGFGVVRAKRPRRPVR